MADDADIAGPVIFLREEEGLCRAREALKRSLRPVGRCYFCTGDAAPGQTFCSPECCEDWQHLQDRRKAQGQ